MRKAIHSALVAAAGNSRGCSLDVNGAGGDKTPVGRSSLTRFVRLSLAILCAALLVPGLAAQSDTSAIAGSVRDASDAVVPKAKVVVRTPIRP